MKFKINSKELSKRLEQLSKVVLPKNVIPILADVMIGIRGSVATLTTSDGEQWLSLKCPIISTDGDTKLCVNIKDFSSLMSNIDGDVTISLKEDTMQLTCNYGNGEFDMPYENAGEYPIGNNADEVTKSIIVDGHRVYNAIRMTEFAVATAASTISVTPVFGGICFKFGEHGMNVSATNKFKIAVYNDNTVKGEECSVTIPHKTIIVMSSLLGGINGDVKLSFGKSYVSVNNRDFKLSSRLIEGLFPKCESIIPKSPTVIVNIKKSDLLLALKRVMPMSNDVSELVVAEFGNGHVTLTTENTVFGKKASETVVCDCDQSMKIGFKGSDLVDIVRNVDDEDITIELTDAAHGGVFYASSNYTKDEYISLLAPSLIQQ